MKANTLFPHQLYIPFFIRRMAAIMFAVTAQGPLFNNFPLTKRKMVVLTCRNNSCFFTTEFAMAYLFASFLRFAAAPSTGWRLLFTFSHNACNAMRGRMLLMRHSIKHYEAKESLKSIISFIFEFDCKNNYKI